MPILTFQEFIIISVCFGLAMTILTICLRSAMASLTIFFTFFFLGLLVSLVYAKYQDKTQAATIKQILLINEGFLEENHEIYSEREALEKNIMSKKNKEILGANYAQKYINLEFEGNKLVMNINKVNQSDLTFCKNVISQLQEQFTNSTIMVNGKNINSVMSSDTSLEYQCQKGEKTVVETMLN